MESHWMAAVTTLRIQPFNLRRAFSRLIACFASTSGEQPIESFWDKPELATRSSEALDLVNDFRDGVANSFGNYRFPVVKLERGIRPDRVCRIYESLNFSQTRLATLGDLDEPGSAA